MESRQVDRKCVGRKMESGEKEREAKMRTGLAGKTRGRGGRYGSDGNIELHGEEKEGGDRGSESAGERGDRRGRAVVSKKPKDSEFASKGKAGRGKRGENKVRKVAVDLESFVGEVKERIREQCREMKEEIVALRRVMREQAGEWKRERKEMKRDMRKLEEVKVKWRK